jgi:hypothetical protein
MDITTKWENQMTEQTVTKQIDASLLCVLAMLCGFMVVSGAATGIVTFLWKCLTTSIMWFIM